MSKKKTHNGMIGAKKGWFAGAILLFGLAVLFGLYVDQSTEISAVELKGHYFSTEDELENAFESPVGVLADSVDFSGIREPLKTLPYVKDVNISMGFRGTLTLEISEREPIGLLINGSQKAYVDRDGIKLPDRLEKATDVPLLYGFSVEPIADTLNSQAFEQVRDFLVSAKENSFGWLTISEVTWNEREGVVALSHENGVKLLFGHENFERKLSNWEAFYAEVVSRKGIESFRNIDLRFRDQIVALEN